MGKSAFNIGQGALKTTTRTAGLIKNTTIDKERQRREAREKAEVEQVAPSIQRAKKRVVNDTQAIQFL